MNGTCTRLARDGPRSCPADFEHAWQSRGAYRAHLAHLAHSRGVAVVGHAFTPGEPRWPGALADLDANPLNLHATDRMESPGPTRVELTAIDTAS